MLQQTSHTLTPFKILEALVPELTIHTSSEVSDSTTSSCSDLDFVTIFKASQNLACILDLDELMCKLTQVILQHSGGDRCIILIPQGDDNWQVRAIATPDTIELCAEFIEDTARVPTKLIQHVKNTQEGVLINDLETDLEIIDEYLHRQQPRSALCLPILNQGNLAGIFYLSNQTNSGVFTRDRILVANFLCIQAGISLENTLCFQAHNQTALNLQQTVTFSEDQRESLFDGMLIIDSQHRINAYNQEFVAIWAIPQTILDTENEHHLLSFILEQLAQPAEFLEKVEYLYQHPEESSYDEIFLKDNRSLERLSSPVTLPSGEQGRIWYFRDITDRKQLEQNQKYLTTILEATTDYIGFASAKGEILWHNKSLRQLRSDLGNAEDHKDISSCHPQWVNNIIKNQALPTAIQNGTWSGELALLDEDRNEIPVSQVIIAHKSADGKVENFSTIMRDIRDRKRTEAALQLSEARANAAFEQAAVGIAESNLSDGKITRNNNYFCQMTGYTSEELQELTMAELTYPEDLLVAHVKMQKLYAGEIENFIVEKRFSRKNGSFFWASTTVSLVQNPEEQSPRCLVIVQDISDRKATEESLKESEAKFRTLVANINGAVYRCRNDADWTMDFISDAITEISGYEAAEFIRNSIRTYASIIHPDDTEYIDVSVAHALVNREPFTLEYRIIHRDGSVRWIYEKGKGIFDQTNQLLFTEGVFFDITDVKTAEAEKAAYQEKLEFLIRKTSLGVIEWNTQFQVVAWNPAAEKIFGYSAEEMLGEHARSIIPAATQAQVDDILAALLEERGGNYSVNENITKDGQIIICEWINTILHTDQREVLGVYSIVQDITARTEAETELKESEAALRHQAIALAELSQSSAISKGQIEQAFQEITECAAHTLQVSRASIWLLDPCGTKLCCQDLYELESQKHSNHQELHLADYPTYFAALEQEGNFAVEDAHIDVRTYEFADSYLIPLDIRSILDCMLGSDGNAFGVFCLESVGEKRVWQAAEENFSRSIANLVTLVIEANHRQQQAQKLEQTLNDLQYTQLQLIQSEKMSSIGQLVAGVAHEINNPVSFIYGNLTHAEAYMTDLLRLINRYQEYYPHPHPAIAAEIKAIELDFLQSDFAKLLKSMSSGTERIQGIVKSLRNFSRLDEAEVKNVDLHEGIDSTLLILRTRLRAQDWRPEIQVIQDYGELPPLNCYAGQLNQVFMNLLSNAIDALEEQDQDRTRLQMEQAPSLIRIRTRLVRETESPTITIAISDNGPGMDKVTHDRLFNPFFTTKPVGKGTGLGLSISYQIVTEKHRGRITCNSELGQGTTFTIALPL